MRFPISALCTLCDIKNDNFLYRYAVQVFHFDIGGSLVFNRILCIVYSIGLYSISNDSRIVCRRCGKMPVRKYISLILYTNDKDFPCKFVPEKGVL